MTSVRNEGFAIATGTEAAVCGDIAERQQRGIEKYGATVRDNPLTLRAWLQHAYEETLDKAVYLKRAIEEIDAQPVMTITRQDRVTGEVRLETLNDDDSLPKGGPHTGDRVILLKK
jgi:hypothetical protein